MAGTPTPQDDGEYVLAGSCSRPTRSGRLARLASLTSTAWQEEREQEAEHYECRSDEPGEPGRIHERGLDGCCGRRERPEEHRIAEAGRLFGRQGRAATAEPGSGRL